MGFLDKAKKLADQAQLKLDEQQSKFNQSSGGAPAGSAGPAVEYDQHGRPIPAAGESTPPPRVAEPAPSPGPGSPLPPSPPAPPLPEEEPPAAPSAPGYEPAPPRGPGSPYPPAPPSPPELDDYQAPKLSSGDPLAG